MLRGLARESRHWNDFIPSLARVCDRDRIHCIDLPGNGSFHEQASPLSIRGYTRHVQEQAESLAAPLGVVGLSLGGMVALDLAQQDRERRFTHVVLINTSTAWSAFYKRARPSSVPFALKSFFQPSREKREEGILGFISNLKSGDKKVLDEWIDIRRQRPVRPANCKLPG